MNTRLLLLLIGATLTGCPGEGSTETDETDTEETDTDTGPNTDCDDFENACALAFDDNGEAIESNDIGEAEDRDFYYIDATTGIYYALKAESYTAGEGEPDTVIRLYDAEKNMIGENDDQPYRLNGTDAGFIFRATADARYYVEVLEWTDWAPESTGADGDPSFDYDMIAIQMPITELIADNDSIASADLALETLKDGDDTNDEFFWYGDPWSDGYLFSVGDIDSGTDTDFFGTWADNSDVGNYTGEVCQWSLFPDEPSALVPVLTLYNEAGVQVAQTEAPDITPDYKVFYDAGISFPINQTGGDYFLEVSDKNGNSGIDHWYSMLHVCYPATFVDPPNPNFVQVSMEVEGQQNLVSMNEGSTIGYWFGRMGGFMDNGAGADVDTYQVIDGMSTATKLSFYIDAVDAGSALVDAEFTILGADGSTVLHTATGANPFVEDLDISTAGSSLFIEVTSATGLTGEDVYYLGLVTVE